MDRDQQRFHAAVAAMTQLLMPENFAGVLEGSVAKKMELSKAMAATCVDLANALLAELDRTKPGAVTPQPDADGWIAHTPTPKPTSFSAVRFADGEEKHGDDADEYKKPMYADFWDHSTPHSDCRIIAWKPA